MLDVFMQSPGIYIILYFMKKTFNFSSRNRGNLVILKFKYHSDKIKPNKEYLFQNTLLNYFKKMILYIDRENDFSTLANVLMLIYLIINVDFY